eukprot:m.238755 g.238755  ORF g.238755 m.238755 type:complete len:256 (+) comp13356_c0_seq1:23-790(+)
MSALLKRSLSAGDEENLQQLGTVCPVADKNLLKSPAETRTWVTLKEGYLLKTKIKKLHKSTKLRMFLLKQDPGSLAARLEYYEGMSFRGAAHLEHARIQPELSGNFLVHTPKRTFYLQSEKGDLKVATAWVLALQQAILSASKNAPKPSSTPTSPSKDAPKPMPVLSPSKSRSELDTYSSGVDEARWAALRKVLNRDTAVDPQDEDVAALRRAEEEEQQRQEQERAAWVAKRPVVPMDALAEADEEAEMSSGDED